MIEPTCAADARRHRRRCQILEIAREAFLTNGYDQTSMSDIATRLGGSKGTLWNYFTSKEEIFTTVVETATQALHSECACLSVRTGDLRGVLTTFCAELLRITLAPERLALQRLVESEACRFPDLAKSYYALGPEALHKRLGAYMRAQMDACHLRYVDPIIAAKTLTALVLSDYQRTYLLYPNEKHTPNEFVTHAEFAVDSFLRIFAV